MAGDMAFSSSLERCVMFSSLHGLHLSGRAHSGSSYGLARAGWAAKEGVMCRRCNQQQGPQRSSRLARCAPYKRKKCGSMAPVESRLRELLDVEYSGAQSTGTWSCVVQPLPGPYLTRRGRYLRVAAGDSQAEGTDDHESSPEVGWHSLDSDRMASLTCLSFPGESTSVPAVSNQQHGFPPERPKHLETEHRYLYYRKQIPETCVAHNLR